MWTGDDALRAPVGDFPPRWANAWGDDRYGLWADLTVNRVSQRMRWIEPTGPAGFWMGSTPQAAGRWVDDLVNAYKIDRQQAQAWLAGESPRHRVMLRQGWWLADTPCTQAFWTAVTGLANPAHFHDRPDSAQRPVEQVSWLDVRDQFLAALHRLNVPFGPRWPGLPTEAEWEYACRSGTETAYHWGDEFEVGRANVDDVEGALRETSVVKRYEPNAWGLHDMHGNVWEWCVDGRRTYTEEAQQDPRGPEGDEEPRVLRGGSWSDSPAGARAAFRDRNHPGDRARIIGFRLALRSPSPGPAGQRPAEPA